MKVSVIIPVFNVAPYIEECLDSVIAQQGIDIECILVDDCSTDHSFAFVEQKVFEYTGPVQFVICRHDVNRGLSAARNTGTLRATGDFIYYLDSDDEILPGGLAALVNCTQVGNPDFVLGSHIVSGTSNSLPTPRMPFGITKGNATILTAFLNGDWPLSACNKLLRRTFVNANQLCFAEGLIHEDELWSLMLACRANVMSVSPEPTFSYRIRPNSIMTSDTKACRFSSWLEILNRMDAFVCQEGRSGNTLLCRYIAIRRMLLLERGEDAGQNPYNIYLGEVREKCPFNYNVFKAMGFGWKVRYLHQFLPPRLGFYYLNSVMRSGRILGKIRQRSRQEIRAAQRGFRV